MRIVKRWTYHVGARGVRRAEKGCQRHGVRATDRALDKARAVEDTLRRGEQKKRAAIGTSEPSQSAY